MTRNVISFLYNLDWEETLFTTIDQYTLFLTCLETWAVFLMHCEESSIWSLHFTFTFLATHYIRIFWVPYFWAILRLIKIARLQHRVPEKKNCNILRGVLHSVYQKFSVIAWGTVKARMQREKDLREFIKS